MEDDGYGFRFPSVDNTICVKCGICINKCPLNKTKETDNNEFPLCYAANSINDQIRQNSSSGGIFSLLAENILSNEGRIYGAAFDDNNEVRHICVKDSSNLNKLRKSKYVQSDLRTFYQDVKSDLNNGIKVFFTGTPCQVAGLYSYLGKRPENLLTADTVCMGVPSPQIFRQYIREIENKYNSKVVTVDFRNKASGWLGYKICLTFSNGSVYLNNRKQDDYMLAFSNRYSLRMSCYHCQFKSIHHLADITLGDFWGIENVCPEMFDDKGTSLILLHSEKGCEAFNNILPYIKTQRVDIQTIKNCNPMLIQSAEQPTDRTEFLKYCKEKSLHKAVSKYILPSLTIRFWDKIRHSIHKIKKIIIK